MPPRPTTRPSRPFFSSGPCAKTPGWSPDDLRDACVGRSHRSKPALEKIKAMKELTCEILGIPNSYALLMIPGSTTGAFETALWSFLGARGVDVWSWDVFSALWAYDIQEELELEDTRRFDYQFEHQQVLPFHLADFTRDQVFTWCGTTSGLWMSSLDWISPQRTGLTLCDATSSAFATPLPWDLLDITAFSWQKALGGEGGHGMLVLSPRAIERLGQYTPPWPIPRLFRLKQQGVVLDNLFSLRTINTPSMICIEDCLNSLIWIQKKGGINEIFQRVQHNFKTVEYFVEQSPFFSFLVDDPVLRSQTPVCLIPSCSSFQSCDNSSKWSLLEQMVGLLETEGVLYDVLNHRNATPCLRIWCGPTVATKDLEAMLPWLDWSFEMVTSERCLRVV